MSDKNLKKELEIIKKKADEYLNGWQRAKADYLNLKKENEKNKVETIQFANAALIAELLPVFENFKIACNHLPKEQTDSDWAVGFTHIKKQFTDFLDQLGIKEIKTVGEKFDPSLHEAVAHEENEDFESDIIFEEVKAGYTLHGKIVNPAKVKVAK